MVLTGIKKALVIKHNSDQSGVFIAYRKVLEETQIRYEKLVCKVIINT